MSETTSAGSLREAADHLARLEALLSRPEVPDGEELLRLSRGVRDAASQAGAQTIERVAQRLEDAAGSFATRGIVWSEELRSLARQTASDLVILIRALNRWGPEEEDRVRTAIERWDEMADASGEGVMHISALFHDDAGPHLVSAPSQEEWADVVPVESLLLQGDAALREALALRPRVDALAERGGADAELRALLDELWDLLRLAAPSDSDAG
jgi:hypothetical protein